MPSATATTSLVAKRKAQKLSEKPNKRGNIESHPTQTSTNVCQTVGPPWIVDVDFSCEIPPPHPTRGLSHVCYTPSPKTGGSKKLDKHPYDKSE